MDGMGDRNRAELGMICVSGAPQRRIRHMGTFTIARGQLMRLLGHGQSHDSSAYGPLCTLSLRCLASDLVTRSLAFLPMPATHERTCVSSSRRHRLAYSLLEAEALVPIPIPDPSSTSVPTSWRT